MKWVLFGVVLAACGRSVAPAYPLHPEVRSASGGPVHVTGAIEHPGEIPYSTGLMLTSAIRLAGGPTNMASGQAEITRVDHKQFSVPIIEIMNGTAPDLELAPGDDIVIVAMR